MGRGRGTSHNCGSGNRGGFGRAGSGKKGDAKKPSYWKNPFQKVAFGMQNSPETTVINVSDIQSKIDALIASGKVKKDAVSLDLTKLGIQKLLASGSITSPVKITVSTASKSAIEKVAAAGGEVILPKEE